MSSDEEVQFSSSSRPLKVKKLSREFLRNQAHDSGQTIFYLIVQCSAESIIDLTILYCPKKGRSHGRESSEIKD